mmetsp:Transcript_5180/g.9039  ORF Transcript_5180/g.9039 Transcript_5180/m.9039 type:complete len:208 (-) Transcript_5180:557-1180(-)
MERSECVYTEYYSNTTILSLSLSRNAKQPCMENSTQQDVDPGFANQSRITRCSVLIDRFPSLQVYFHRAPNGDHICAECKYNTNNKSNLFTHVISTHLDCIPFGCSMCSVTTSSHTNLSHHMRRSHEVKLGNGGAYMRCSSCSASFSAPLNLLEHYFENHWDESEQLQAQQIPRSDSDEQTPEEAQQNTEKYKSVRERMSISRLLNE